jgi:predicted DNA-binding transcriptional regulator YafY
MFGGKLRHGVEVRFEFIEFRAYWHGRLNRSDLIDRFGVSQTQASQDLKAYQELAPSNLCYDGVDKTYRCAKTFTPRFFDLSADSYLAPLLAMHLGTLEPTSSWLRTIPPFHVSPTPARAICPEILRSINQAREYARAIEIKYQSMSNPQPSWRWIEPHAYAFDGLRWHVRALCRRDGVFKDFLLSRIMSTRDNDQPSPATSSGAQDVDWNTAVTMVIAPHPGLSEGQRQAIRLDYGMDAEDRNQITVQKSMLNYAVRRLGLDTDPLARRPQDQQIVLLNRDEILGRMATAGSSRNFHEGI